MQQVFCLGFLHLLYIFMFILLLWLRVPGEVFAHMRSGAEEALRCLLCLPWHGYHHPPGMGSRDSSSLLPIFLTFCSTLMELLRVIIPF